MKNTNDHEWNRNSNSLCKIYEDDKLFKAQKQSTFQFLEKFCRHIMQN